MSRNQDDKPNQEPEYSLEEILAEFSSKRQPVPAGLPLEPEPPAAPEEPEQPKSEEPEQPKPEERNPAAAEKPEEAPPAEKPRPVSRPSSDGKRVAGTPKKQAAGKREAPKGAKKQAAAPDQKPDNVVPFPRRQNPFAALLSRLSGQMDEYADQMYSEEGTESSEATKRAEELIPGVDEEETPVSRVRRRRREEPPPPDLPPQELFKRYNHGLKSMRNRVRIMVPLCLVQLYLILASILPAIPLPALLAEHLQLQIWLSAGLLLAALVVCADVVLQSVFNLLRFSLGMDTLVVLSCLATLADALTMTALGGRDGQLPYCGVCTFALFFTLWGACYKRRGRRLACRTAASSAEPYVVTLDEGKWDGRDTYAKWPGTTDGFGSQIQTEDGAQRIFRSTAPVMLVAALVFSIISSLGRHRPEHLLWCLSATLTAAASFSALLVYGKPFYSLARRLSQSGAALAGWPGVEHSRRGSGILLTDLDLFPPGAVELNGIKVFGNWPIEKVVGYTATLVRDSGCGLEKVFYDLLRTQGAVYRKATGLCCYEAGGVSATIRGEQVLVGSAAFMKMMEVALPQGLNIKNAVFCAIEGELAGIFALNYTLPGPIAPALTALLRNRVQPVLATRDFNIIPAMLQQRFRLPVEKMEFPPVERRRELSDPAQEHSTTLTAILCREGLAPFTEAVVGGKRLRTAVRAGSVLTCLGSIAGLLLTFYLTFVDAYRSLSPLNLLLFMLAWTVPTWLISGWVNQY